MAISVSCAALFLVVVTTQLMMSSVQCISGRCETDPDVQKTLLYMCFYEQGFTDFESMFVFQIKVGDLCSMQTKFIKAIECQIGYLKRCAPHIAVMVPSVEPDGIPAFINGVCNTPGFNSTCFDRTKGVLNTCTRYMLQQSISMRRAQYETNLPPTWAQLSHHHGTFGTKQDIDLCDLMQYHATDCAKRIMKVCGDLTMNTLIKYIPSSRPSKCLLKKP